MSNTGYQTTYINGKPYTISTFPTAMGLMLNIESIPKIIPSGNASPEILESIRQFTEKCLEIVKKD